MKIYIRENKVSVEGISAIPVIKWNMVSTMAVYGCHALVKSVRKNKTKLN